MNTAANITMFFFNQDTMLQFSVANNLLRVNANHLAATFFFFFFFCSSVYDNKTV